MHAFCSQPQQQEVFHSDQHILSQPASILPATTKPFFNLVVLILARFYERIGSPSDGYLLIDTWPAISQSNITGKSVPFIFRTFKMNSTYERSAWRLIFLWN